MDNQSFGVDIQWIHTTNDIKNSAQLIADARQLEVAEILDGSGGDEHNSEFLDDNGDTDLDHIAAENLIFMARDGQMVNEIIAAEDAETVVMAAGDSSTIELEQAAALVQPTLIVDSGAYSDMYDEDAPQMVTEEVITDDWVQHQGEERVEIPADQIIGSNSSQVLLDMVQDEYTALRPYPCDFCSRRFRKKASLNNHMIAHQNDRPHLCKLCGARFSRRVDLINHFKAHAEQQVADEAIQADAVVKFEPARRPLDDHYYEQDWHFQTSASSTQNSEVCPEILITDTPTESISANSSSASSLTAVSSAASTTVTTRGRISRLKPKEEAQYIIVEEKVIPPEIEYMECQDLQAATAAVKLTQDQSPVHQQNFPVIDENKPFVCQECGLAFGREKALLSHMKNHRVDSPIECTQCNEMFWDTNSLNEHQKTHQFEESNSEFEPPEADDTQSESESEQLYGEYYCNECGISFHRQDLLRRHLKQHSKKTASSDGAKNVTAQTADSKSGRHCCNTCGETFEEALDLLAHAEIHARFPSFKCVLCGEAFYEEQSIKRHLQTRHPHEMTPNSCILCGKECRDRKALIKHAWDHSREKCHSCSKCGKNFHNKARLKRHMASHRDKSVICDVCQEEFPDGRSLSNHRHSHSATSSGKLFPCNECGKSFGSRSSQQIHVRIHTGERPYGCRYCWKAFADGGTLRKHERIHTGEKPYACSVCPRAFNQRVVLREHIRSHHSGKDASRGTYFCTVCSAEMMSSNELIQHLIQHSDMNTAKQRQPVTGPRKYKRRRKLQPHEIAHLQTKYKTENLGSDIDMSDFDIDNVGDLLGITESGNKANTVTNNRKNKKNENAASKRAISNGKSAAGGRAIKAEESHIEEDSASISAEDNNNTSGKQRYDSLSSNSDKLWESKFLQSVTNSSLFTSDDQELPIIDSFVVNNNPPQGSPKTRRFKQSNTGSQRTQEVQSKTETAKAQTTTSRTRKKPIKNQPKTNTRPRMIHTEKSRSTPAQEGKRTRSKTYITRTETTNLDLLSSKSNSTTTIVDDYEIISPATQPPNQISSSPLHIKQESEQHHNQQNQLHMYDAHLLLEASSLRKEAFEKFNPSIVNDLEEILRSPLKSDRNARQRFTSESSTTPQFLPEDERNLIKIEPTSPDLREIVEGQQSVTTSQPGTSARTTQLRQNTANNKYLLDTDINVKAAKRGVSLSGSKRLNGNISQRHNINSIRATKAATSANSSSSSYLNYTVDAYNVSVPAGNNSSDVGSTFFSISEVVSAADAAAAAASSAQAAVKPDRKVRQFECEMCSAVFYDRTQLLEHVHIHI